jgi:hypothetical protein
MDQPSGDALAGSGFAEQEHRGVGRRHLRHSPPHMAKRLAVAHEIDRFIP